MSEGYISIRNWRRFQHYDPAKRGQPWIKDYVEQLDDDDYRDLSFAQRGLLQDLRRTYARAQCQLSADTVKLSRRLGSQVTRRLLDPLIHAGFVEIVASKELADGYHAASKVASTEVEGEVEERITSVVRGPRNVGGDNGETTLDFDISPETELDYERMLREMPG